MSGTEDDATADERWLVVGGRRWRRIDPTIPEAERAPLRERRESALGALDALEE